MEKRLYGKPLMSMEQFTPSEYVSLCWYIKEGDCYGNLYLDSKQTPIKVLGVTIDSWWGYYDSGEQVSNSNHGSHRVPAESAQVKYFKGNLPQPESGNYYTSYGDQWIDISTGTIHPYDGKVTVYKYTHGGTTHYFKEPTSAGNHS